MTDTHAILSKLDHQTYISGSSLAQELDVSRTAIWKSIAGLKKLGIDIFAVKGKGYKLACPIELLSSDLIKSNLPKEIADNLYIEIKSSIPSTNSYLAEYLRDQDHDYSLCIAEQQTAGRGRLGRYWVSPFAANIYMSLLWKTTLSSMQLASSSLCVALAVVSALSKFGVNDIGIKWPNDIYWQGKKLAGILIESSGEAYGKHNVVIGIGLNVNMPESYASEIEQDWTDLGKITGNFISRNELIPEIVIALQEYLHRFEQHGITSISDEWQKYDVLNGKMVKIIQTQSDFSGMAQGIDLNGALLVETENGLQAVYGGEVSCRLDI